MSELLIFRPPFTGGRMTVVLGGGALKFSKKGSTPTPWSRGLRDQIQKWAPLRTENPLFLGFSVLRGGLRPWSETMVLEGARPWGRGRSGDCQKWLFSLCRVGKFHIAGDRKSGLTNLCALGL